MVTPTTNIKGIHMSKISQVNAVIKYTVEVLGERYQLGQDAKLIATKEDQVEISHRITADMLEGLVDLSDSAKEKYGTRLREAYVMGMIRNHWKKCLKLNGNVQYQPAFRRGTDQ
jgi:hypothetical protein